VLLIDDDPDRTEIIARDLQAEGLEVTAVREKREAIRALDSPRGFDCAVVVLALPTGARLELARELRQRFPAMRVALASGHRLKVQPTGQASERAMRLEPTPGDGRRLAKALRSRLVAA
jgi:CheY-like chemotaxis protein